MATYIRQDAEFEAMQLKAPQTPAKIAAWCNGKVCHNDLTNTYYITVEINADVTLLANYGDWIAKQNGKWFVYLEHHFPALFKPV